MATSYISEHTKFMTSLFEKHPELTEAQIKSRARLWDVALDEEEEAGFKASSLPTKAYPYQID